VKGKAKGTPPPLLVKADPREIHCCARWGHTANEIVSEDDFEQDVKRDAKEYAERLKVDHKRLEIKDENKRRKQDGLNPLPLPRRVKEKKARIVGYDTVSEEEPELSDLDIEDGRRRKRRRVDDEEGHDLQYEGREYLYWWYQYYCWDMQNGY
jgi:hypothetical protein